MVLLKTWRGGLAVLLVLLAVAPSASAQEAASSSPDTVFARMTNAWRTGDEATLAALVHPDGLRVTHGGDYNRFTLYSPDQAHYFFQDLLARGKHLELIYRRLPDPPEATGCMGLVEWRYRPPGYETSEVYKLVVVLTRHGDGWFMSEFNSISAR